MFYQECNVARKTRQNTVIFLVIYVKSVCLFVCLNPEQSQRSWLQRVDVTKRKRSIIIQRKSTVYSVTRKVLYLLCVQLTSDLGDWDYYCIRDISSSFSCTCPILCGVGISIISFKIWIRKWCHKVDSFIHDIWWPYLFMINALYWVVNFTFHSSFNLIGYNYLFD